MQKIDLRNLDKSDWKPYRFDQIVKNISERVEPGETELEIYIGLEHIDAESIHIKRFGKPSDVEGQKLKCYPGDVIFGKRRAYQRKASVVTTEAICSAHAFVLRANPEVIDPRLLPFFLHSDLFMHRAVDISAGGLSPTINWGILKIQEFILPPKDQQAELAELLWAMDEVIEKDLSVLEKLDNHRVSLINDFLKRMENSDLTKLGEITTVRTGKLDSNAATENGTYPFFTCSPVTLAIDNYAFDCEALLLAGNNAEGNFNVKHYSGKFNAYQRTYVIEIIENRSIGYEYLFEVLKFRLQHLKKMSVGSSTKFLTLKVIQNIQVPVLNINAEATFVGKVKALNCSIQATNSKILTSKSLQKSLINEVF